MRHKLKEIRLKKQYTHEQIANIVGISRSAYTNIERGTKNPSLSVAKKIKDALAYKKDDIFFD